MRFYRFILIILLGLVLTIPEPNLSRAEEISSKFKPTPAEDTYNGRNSNVYLPHTDTLTTKEKQLFINQIAKHAEEANEKWGIPASSMIGMAALESGYGTTRIAFFANNIFGVKVWGANPENAWQLKGQPDEDLDTPVPVIADYGDDRKVFKESVRRDNWYRNFNSYQEAVNYLAGTLLLNKRYFSARDDYQYRIKNGWSDKEASKQYIYDIANAGYNHLGGDYYRKAVGGIMDQWNLYQYDVGNQARFKDIKGHWAHDAIDRLAELAVISGFPDGTFRPEERVTREQFVKMLVTAAGESPIRGKATFTDVPESRWSNPYIESAVSNNITPLSDYGARFRPSQTITRQETAVLSARALSLQPEWPEFAFKDNHLIDNRTGLVGAAVRYGIIVGFEDNTFRPSASLTRAQAAVIITRLLDDLQK
ncbi:S-layer homology domain-containing protein [Paenibacillus tarimensis]